MSRQKKLQAEAKLALAMAKPMAKMQVEVEKQNRKKSPVADLVSTRFIYLLLTMKFQINNANFCQKIPSLIFYMTPVFPHITQFIYVYL